MCPEIKNLPWDCPEAYFALSMEIFGVWWNVPWYCPEMCLSMKILVFCLMMDIHFHYEIFFDTFFNFYNFQFLNFYKRVMSKNLPWVPWVPWMCPKHENLRCQLSIVLSVDCPEICPESKNMCPKHGNLRCRMKCALRLPWKIKICPETALRAHFALSKEIFGCQLMMIRYFLLILVKNVT